MRKPTQSKPGPGERRSNQARISELAQLNGKQAIEIRELREHLERSAQECIRLRRQLRCVVARANLLADHVRGGNVLLQALAEINPAPQNLTTYEVARET